MYVIFRYFHERRHLFKNEELLEESIETALYDKTIRGDDLEFHSAVRNGVPLLVTAIWKATRSILTRTGILSRPAGGRQQAKRRVDKKTDDGVGVLGQRH
jgi:hypothetical protein